MWSRGSPGTSAAHRGDTDHPPARAGTTLTYHSLSITTATLHVQVFHLSPSSQAGRGTSYPPLLGVKASHTPPVPNGSGHEMPPLGVHPLTFAET
eukprot:1184646-Prorocentrum_minimum.AAC.2